MFGSNKSDGWYGIQSSDGGNNDDGSHGNGGNYNGDDDDDCDCHAECLFLKVLQKTDKNIFQKEIYKRSMVYFGILLTGNKQIIREKI